MVYQRFDPESPLPHITAAASETPRAWCVAEYFMNMPDQLGASLMITAAKLSEVFMFIECNRNSEWRKLVKPDSRILTMIYGIGEKHDCMREASRLIISRGPSMPRCNLYGGNSMGTSRAIECSNGETYATQSEAAETLGLSQSHISRHLKGLCRDVRGFKFSFKD